MIAKIFGIIWILLGILWIFKPQMLRNRFKKKMSRKGRRIFFFFILMASFVMVGSVIKAPRMTAKIVGVIGMFVAIKAIMVLTSRTSEKVLSWWAERPLGIFRAWAVVIFITGVLLMLT